MEFVGDLPPETRPGRKPPIFLEELRRNPGKWAVIERYHRHRGSTARSRGTQFVKRHADVEYAVRTFETEVVLYMRAVES